MKVYYRLLLGFSILLYRVGNRLALVGFDLRNVALKRLTPTPTAKADTDAIARKMLGLKPTDSVDEFLRGMFK